MKVLISISTHFEDLYGKGFVEFRKKYLPLVKKKQANDLWVHFTDYSKDVLEKAPYQDPDHKDPVGIYGYPLKYVVENPADLWYGQRCKYVRVLKARVHPGKVINVQSLHQEWFAKSFLNSLGYTPSQIDEYLRLAKKFVRKYFMDGDKNTLGKAAFFVFQHDMTTGPDYQQRSGVEQTKLLLKAGIHAVVDDASRPNKAVINNREPEQIIFLTREFDVIDIFENNRVTEPGLVTTKTDDTDLALRLASKIARKIGDTLPKKRPKTDSENGWNLMWTSKGRRISIIFRHPSRYYERRMGEKLHKEYKLVDEQYPVIVMHSEKGKLERSFMSDSKFDEIAADFAEAFAASTDVDANWTPETQKIYVKRLEDQRYAEARKRRAEMADYARKDIHDNLKTSLDWCASRFKVNIDKLYTASDDTLLRLSGLLTQQIRKYRELGIDAAKWDGNDEWVQKVFTDEDLKVCKPVIDLLVKIYETCASDKVRDFHVGGGLFSTRKDEVSWPLYIFKYAYQELTGDNA